MRSFDDTNLVAFLDNAEDRILVEYDAEFAEEHLMSNVYSDQREEPLAKVWNNSVITHIGLGNNWAVSKIEYTGDTYIITIQKDYVGVV